MKRKKIVRILGILLVLAVFGLNVERNTILARESGFLESGEFIIDELGGESENQLLLEAEDYFDKEEGADTSEDYFDIKEGGADTPEEDDTDTMEGVLEDSTPDTMEDVPEEDATDTADDILDDVPDGDWDENGAPEDGLVIEGETILDVINLDEDGNVSEENIFETEALEMERTGECGAKPQTIFWSLDEDGVLILTGSGQMACWEQAEDVPWNEFRPEIKEIRIEEGISSIGAYAFCNCENMEDIDIPDTVLEIGAFAFYKCSGLTSVSIG